MNSGYLLKRLISVEVQDEERPTSPALLRSSSSHTPYSKDTSGNLSTTSSPTRVVSLLVWCCCDERVSPPPFIAWIGRFPRESNMGTLGTDVGMAVAICPPKLGPVGAKVGSGDPGVRPTPGCRLSHRLSSWTLPGGPPSCVCRCLGSVRRFSLSNGPFL